jgi:hypothetical protein
VHHLRKYEGVLEGEGLTRDDLTNVSLKLQGLHRAVVVT